MSSVWFAMLLRASLQLLVGGATVVGLLRIYPVTSARWHRFIWGAVLLQGLLFVPYSFSIPTPKWLTTLRSAPRRAPFVGVSRHAMPTPHDTPVSPVADAQLPSVVATANEQGPRKPTEQVAPRLATTEPTVTTMGASRNVAEPPSTPFARLRESRATSLDSMATQRSHHENDLVKSTTYASSLASWRRRIAMAWLSGVIGVSAWGLLNYMALQRALRKARPAGRRWTQELQQLSLEFKLASRVRLDVHPSIGPLICWTRGQYRIVVPALLWSELTSDERVAVLHHELTHLLRGDLWKSMLARIIVAMHWFNPLAWISLKRFDEAAEWACDATMVGERPLRATQLANALLAATTAKKPSAMLTMAATSGPLFQRVHRLLSIDQRGDTRLRKTVWGLVVTLLISLGLFRGHFVTPLSAQTTESPRLSPSTTSSDESPASAADEDVDSRSAEPTTPSTTSHADNDSPGRLEELAARIIAADDEQLQKFVALLRTPAGRIVMEDRAALQTQNVAGSQDDVSAWQQFVASHFQAADSVVRVNPEFAAIFASFVASVRTAEAESAHMTPVLQEIASSLDASEAPAQLLQRFLNHPGTAPFVYHRELQSRLHPRMDELMEAFSEELVQGQSGRVVIRPARRSRVEHRLASIDRAAPILKRLHEELTAWSDDLADLDDLHTHLQQILKEPDFALYVASSEIPEEGDLTDEQFDGIFYRLEEATKDGPAGLIIDVESEPWKELETQIQQYEGVRNHRGIVQEPLAQLVERLDDSDELHRHLKSTLRSDFARMIVARKIDYSPVTAEEATRSWLANWVTRDDQGRSAISTDSPDEMVAQIEDYFREFREIRRRGRTFDEFAEKLSEQELKASIQSLSGKLLLTELVERSSVEPHVDGLQRWFDAHFEDTADGLKLMEGAQQDIEEMLHEAEQLEDQLSHADF